MDPGERSPPPEADDEPDLPPLGVMKIEVKAPSSGRLRARSVKSEVVSDMEALCSPALAPTSPGPKAMTDGPRHWRWELERLLEVDGKAAGLMWKPGQRSFRELLEKAAAMAPKTVKREILSAPVESKSLSKVKAHICKILYPYDPVPKMWTKVHKRRRYKLGQSSDDEACFDSVPFTLDAPKTECDSVPVISGTPEAGGASASVCLGSRTFAQSHDQDNYANVRPTPPKANQEVKQEHKAHMSAVIGTAFTELAAKYRDNEDKREEIGRLKERVERQQKVHRLVSKRLRMELSKAREEIRKKDCDRAALEAKLEAANAAKDHATKVSEGMIRTMQQRQNAALAVAREEIRELKAQLKAGAQAGELDAPAKEAAGARGQADGTSLLNGLTASLFADSPEERMAWRSRLGGGDEANGVLQAPLLRLEQRPAKRRRPGF